MKKKIAIIGGGASGLTASIVAGRLGNDVTVFEKADRVGKKILVTGNGKCNLTNVNLSPDKYNDGEFVGKVLKTQSVGDVLSFFEGIGVLTVVDGEGRVYPRTKTATSVLNCLRGEIARLGVKERTGVEVKEVVKKDKFEINGEKFDRVIISTGGGKTVGGLGLISSELRPSLSGIITDKKYIVGLNGKRIDGVLTLRGKTAEVVEKGEILFRDYGLSGIAVFNLSAYISRGGEYALYLDAVPEIDVQSLEKEISRRDLTNPDTFDGLIDKNLARNVLKECKTPRETAMLLKNIPFKVSGVRAEGAQVTCGGIKVEEIDEKFESKKHKGLFITGEALDVDGLCGGYNLSWAWISGIIAGREASRD